MAPLLDEHGPPIRQALSSARAWPAVAPEAVVSDAVAPDVARDEPTQTLDGGITT
jgi:hypothetical protein